MSSFLPKEAIAKAMIDRQISEKELSRKSGFSNSKLRELLCVGAKLNDARVLRKVLGIDL